MIVEWFCHVSFLCLATAKSLDGTPGGVPGPRLKFSFQNGASQARQLLGDLGTLLPPKALTTSKYSSSLGVGRKKPSVRYSESTKPQSTL